MHRRIRHLPLIAPVALVAALTLSACGSSTTELSGRQEAVRDTSTDVSFDNCASQCTGEIDGAKYAIKLPEKWNGTLLLYSHGYRFAQAGPPSFDEPSTAAQVSSTDEDGSGSDPLSTQLLDKGYALAGSSYKSNGWAVKDGVDADEALHKKFVDLVGTPKRTYVWGDSLGGLITQLVAERNGDWVDGAAPMCGAVAGPNLNLDVALDVAFAIKTLIDPSLKLTGFASADEANAEWRRASAAVQKAAADTAGGGTAKVLLAAALVDAPNRTATYDGSDLVSQVKATVEALLTAVAYGTTGRYEIEQRVGGNPSSNEGVDYSARLDDGEKTLITAAGGKLTTLEQDLADAPRVSADEKARKAFAALGDPTGKLTVPTLTMHTEFDPLVLAQNETVLQQRVIGKGKGNLLSQLYIAPPGTYSESSGAPYGAGHCNFSDEQRVALVQALDTWVRSGVYPSAVGLTSSFGQGLAPAFSPGPWPATTGS